MFVLFVLLPHETGIVCSDEVMPLEQIIAEVMLVNDIACWCLCRVWRKKLMFL